MALSRIVALSSIALLVVAGCSSKTSSPSSGDGTTLGTNEDALTADEAAAAVQAGRRIADEEVDAGADLLIAEALFFDRRVKYHLDYAGLKGNLERIGAKRVILTHMGPEMLSHIADVPEETAEDGMIVEI